MRLNVAENKACMDISLFMMITGMSSTIFFFFDAVCVALPFVIIIYKKVYKQVQKFKIFN